MPRLTDKEIIEAISDAISLNLLLWRQVKILQENVKFLIEQNLKMGVDIYKAGKKTPWKRLDEAETTLDELWAYLEGMNKYYQERLSGGKPPPKEETYDSAYK